MTHLKNENQGEINNQSRKVNTSAYQNELPLAEHAGEATPTFEPFSGTPIHTQASHLNDPHFQIAQRQGIARQIGHVAGNRHLQRAIAAEPPTHVLGNENPGSVRMIQRGIWESLSEWWSGLFSSDPEDVVENLDSGLERAGTVLDAAASTTTDPQRRRQIERLSEHIHGLQGATGRIVQVLDTAEKIETVEEFIDALNDIPDDISSDPEGAADAFGRLFASAGELGGELPEGPWSMYFTFLSHSRNFFTDMSRALNPDIRWRRQFEEMEREAGHATTRGVD